MDWNNSCQLISNDCDKINECLLSSNQNGIYLFYGIIIGLLIIFIIILLLINIKRK